MATKNQLKGESKKGRKREKNKELLADPKLRAELLAKNSLTIKVVQNTKQPESWLTKTETKNTVFFWKL